jgi:hypothetical protein
MPLFYGFTFNPEVLFNPLPFAQITNTIAAHPTKPVSGCGNQNRSLSICSIDNEEAEQRFGAERHNRSCQETG